MKASNGDSVIVLSPKITVFCTCAPLVLAPGAPASFVYDVPETFTATWVEGFDALTVWPVVSNPTECPRELQLFYGGTQVTRTAVNNNEKEYVQT